MREFLTRIKASISPRCGMSVCSTMISVIQMGVRRPRPRDLVPTPVACRHRQCDAGDRRRAGTPRPCGARGVMSRNATGAGSRSTDCSDAGSARSGLAADLGETAGLRRCRRADHLAGVGGLHHQPSPPTRRRCPPCPGQAGRATRARAGRSRVGPVPGWLDHQDPPDLRTGPKATVAGPHGRPARGQPPVRAGARPEPHPPLQPGRPRTRPDRIRADKAYSAKANWPLRSHPHVATINIWLRALANTTFSTGPKPSTERSLGRIGYRATAGRIGMNSHSL
jgi:hypothetical protein